MNNNVGEFLTTQQDIKNLLLSIMEPILPKVTKFDTNHIGYRYFNADGSSFGCSTNPKWYSINKTKEFFENQRLFLEE